jgi:hypothetical protein
VNLIQRHVSGLRRALEPDRVGHTQSGLLTWTEARYLLTLPPGALDLDIYEGELARARAARGEGQLRQAGACPPHQFALLPGEQPRSLTFGRATAIPL